MSAGGLSYSAIIGHTAKVTLPSVEMWGGNMNILRDPPKALYTRKIDKVGETSSITQMIQDSGDRACEAIKVFPRGINPMVSVSYNNIGNNGGQRGFNPGGLCNNLNAKMPYTIMRDGVFRPPVIRQENLMPLSRQPRVWTTAFTKPGFPDFSKKMICSTENPADYRAVHNSTLQGHVRPTAIYNIEKPHAEPMETKYSIQTPISVNCNSRRRCMDLTTQEVKEPYANIIEEPNHYTVTAKYGSELLNKHDNTSEINKERYTKDIRHFTAISNPSQNVQITPISEIMDLDIRLKDTHNTSYVAPLSGNQPEKYIHADLDLERRLPSYLTQTNIGKNIYRKTVESNDIILDRKTPNTSLTSNPGSMNKPGDNYAISSRDYHLSKQANFGSFQGRGQMPMQGRMQNVNENYNTEKANLSRKVMSQFEGRYLK